jgi:hypothetical protein
LQCVEPPGERVPFERIEFNGSEANIEKWFGLNCIRGPGSIFVRFRGKEYSTDTIGNLQAIITADEEEDFCIRFDDYDPSTSWPGLWSWVDRFVERIFRMRHSAGRIRGKPEGNSHCIYERTAMYQCECEVKMSTCQK